MANSSYGKIGVTEIVFLFHNKTWHNKPKYKEKSNISKWSKKTEINSKEVLILSVSECDTNQNKRKNKNLFCWQQLLLVTEDKKVYALMHIESNFILIR